MNLLFFHGCWDFSGFSHLSSWSFSLSCWTTDSATVTIHIFWIPEGLPHLLLKYLTLFWTSVILLLWFYYLGDAKIGNNNVSSLKNDDFTMRGLRRDGNADDIWAASQNSKSCGKSISIETANLREYARYVLRTICQQVFFRFNLPLTLNNCSFGGRYSLLLETYTWVILSFLLSWNNAKFAWKLQY